MHIDILFFALVAAFLVYRLNSVLGTRSGDEPQRPNPFAPAKDARPAPVAVSKPAAPPVPVVPAAGFDQIVDRKANEGGRIEAGLAEIAAADAHFTAESFMAGARAAFEMIVKAYAAGDLDTLRPLLSPKLYKDFKAGIEERRAAGRTQEITIHRIRAARIVEAHLGGAMAYVTVDYDVEETAVTRDAEGNVVEGDAGRVFSVEDIWTFTRDVRSADPNWTLIETRAVEKG